MNINEMTMTAKRQIALFTLRMNPKNRRQTTGRMKDHNGDRCALGLIAEAFGIPCSYEEMEAKGIDKETYAPLVEVGEALGINYAAVYRLNDSARLSFAEIADEMEKAFETGKWDVDYTRNWIM